MDPLQDKWNSHFSSREIAETKVVEVLSENTSLLPKQGLALDLASGLGGNAILLAKHGLKTTAWDLSAVAVNKLQQFAATNNLQIDADVRDVIANPPKPERFDVITVSNFLDRKTCGAIASALKVGGLLYYQTWSQQKVDDTGPSNPEFLLYPQELLQLFSTLNVIYYREEGLLSNPNSRYKNRALLIAQKPTQQ